MSDIPLISTEKGWIKLNGDTHQGRRGYPGVQASLTTAMSGSNNDLLIQARRAGTAGNSKKVQWGNLGGFSAPTKAYHGGLPATATITPGSGTPFIFIAQNPGTGGNSISVTLSTNAVPSNALAISVSGNDITALLANDAGTVQVDTATAVGTITGAGNATVIVTAALLTGSPKTYSVAVANSDTAATWAGKVRTALAADAALTAHYTIGGTSASITISPNVAAANDSTLNISLDNGTCTGITTAGTSTNTTAGVAPAVTTTAALLVAAINANVNASQLVQAYLTQASSGAIAAVTKTLLTGGTTDANLTYVSLGTNSSGATNATGSQLLAVIQNSDLQASLASGNDGTGTVAALTVTNLSGGLDGFGLAENLTNIQDLQTVNMRPGGQDRTTTKTLEPITTRTGNNRLLRTVPGLDAARYAQATTDLQKSHGPRSPYL